MELKFQKVYFGEQQGKNGKRKGFESPPKLGMTLRCAYMPPVFTYMLLVVCHFDTGRLLWGWELRAMVSDKEENRCPASALMAATLYHTQFKERVTECELEAFCSESCYIHKVATFFTTLTTKFYQGQSSASMHSQPCPPFQQETEYASKGLNSQTERWCSLGWLQTYKTTKNDLEPLTL